MRLSPEQLRRPCAPQELPFESTADLERLEGALGQTRALSAISFGIGIRREGYNLYAMGPAGSGRHSTVLSHLEQQVQDQPVPSDWCYVHNFDDPYRPCALRLPAGRARALAKAMARLVDDLRAVLPAAFETDRYRAQLRALEDEFSQRHEGAFETVLAKAQEHDVAVVRSEQEWTISPMLEGQVLEDAAFEALPAAERQRLNRLVDRYTKQLEKLLDHMPKWRREAQRRIRALNRKVAQTAVTGLLEETRKEFAGLPEVRRYLARVQQDVVDNADDFRPPLAEEQEPLPGCDPEAIEALLQRYRVNVLLDHSSSPGAPIVYEDHPTHANLVGRIEHISEQGALLTDFTLIKAGAMHRANGGYLIIEAEKLLAQPSAWDSLKRALRAHAVKIESTEELASAITTITLQPQPIPLDLKVILVGGRQLYEQLYQLDSDFRELFKVLAEFEEDMERTPATSIEYARLLGTLIRKEDLRDFDRGAVARVIEESSRLAEDTEKLSLQMRLVVDLLVESDYQATLAGAERVRAQDVQQAIDAQAERAGAIRERLLEAIVRRELLIDTSGSQIGQVNGLAVLELGGHHFGHPLRITARVRVGMGEVIDIEREADLGGPLHSKGVLILSGYLAGRYSPDRPLSLFASLVFEQSYSECDGDSASSAELYALLSALAEVPIRQDLAVTGSVNQLGEVQPIGGVNEKIEGFFETCRRRGLTGSQGVLVPASNVGHLMLGHPVVEAVRSGLFQVHAVSTIDEGLALLTGENAGSLTDRIERRLALFAERALPREGRTRRHRLSE